MADRIGVLGEATANGVGVTTVYTVPTAKMAKAKLMFLLQGNAAGNSVVSFIVNGMTIATISAMTASFYVFSISNAGLRVAEQAAVPTGIGAGLTVAPADQVYFLNTGDTIQYSVSGAALISMNCQVVGIELDTE